MDANPRSIKDLFELQTRYLVPLFQRPYVWQEEKQWEPLWEDIQAVAERQIAKASQRPHFLGALVLEQLNTPTATINAREVIDGQQRLTTLQLIIAAVRDICQEIGSIAAKHQKNFELLTWNSNAERTGSDDSFKVWPTNVDRDDFRKVMSAGSAKRVRELYPQNSEDDDGGSLRSIPEAYMFFSNAIRQWLQPDLSDAVSARLDALRETIYKGLMTVVIDLDEKDNAQVIFETLNARGTPLLAADLVKNYLLHLAEENNQPVQELYEKYWLPFDDKEKKFWREETRQGRLFRPRIEQFLQHYLALKTGLDVAAGDLFVTFKGEVTGANLSPEESIKDFRHFAKIFRGFFEHPAGTWEGEFFRRLDHLDTTTVYPFLLFIYDRFGRVEQDSVRREMLSYLESFLVRRTICGLTIKNYNNLFISLAGHFKDNDEDPVDEMRRYLLEKASDIDRWPADDEFQTAWKMEPVYKRLRRRRLRMVLEALEVALRTNQTEDMPLPKHLTVEHLLPREWKENYPLPAETDAAKEERKNLLHTIGNLTLTTAHLNSSIKNGPWLAKRKAITKKSVLLLNSQLDDEEWNDKKIVERTKRLFKLAKQIWPYPG